MKEDKEKKKEEGKKGPVLEARVGRFQVSLWRRKRTMAARKHYQTEREHVVERICIQRGRYNKRKGEWENQRIWCNPMELRDLAGAMDKFEDLVVEKEE